MLQSRTVLHMNTHPHSHRDSHTSSMYYLTCQVRMASFTIHYFYVLLFYVNGLCIFTTEPTCVSWETRSTQVGKNTHTHVRRQRLAVLDLQPRTITCDLAPLKLVTNSILEQLIRHAWALGFFYVVIKARVYGRPQALGWMIVLTSSEPKATHSWGGMRCVQAAELPQKQPLIHRGGWLRCIGKWFLLLLLVLCLTPRNCTH